MSQTSLRLRVVPRYPARVTATNGISATRSGVDLTIKSDYGSLVQVPDVTNPDRTFVLVWDADIDNYQSLSFTNIINNVQDAVIGPTLAAIDAANPGANQVVYFTDVGEASTFTASEFVRGISNSADGNAFLSAIGGVGISNAQVSYAKILGAIGDGAADDTIALEDAQANYGSSFLPKGTYKFNGLSSAIPGRFFGDGIIQDNDGKRGRFFSAISAEPSRGDHTSVLTAFNGDYTNVPFPVEHRITGASTLGAPTSGYLYTPEAYPHYTYLFNNSGHNESLTGNGGRTAAVAYRTKIGHAGQGDAVAYNASVTVSGSLPGATGDQGWLASPAGVLLNGEVIAAADGVYLNNMEINLDGATYDVAGVGCVFNFIRNDDAGALGAGWDGIRFQSIGSKAINSGIRFTGAGGFQAGINLIDMNSPNQAAIVMKSGHRIYFDGSDPSSTNLFDFATGNTYITSAAPGGGLTAVVNNNAVLQLASAQANRSIFLSGLVVRPSGDDASAFRVFGASATAYGMIGQTGNTTYLTANSDGTDNTALSLRTSNGGVEADRIVVGSDGRITFSNFPVYADNAAAIAGGLGVNVLYRTSTGEVRARV